MYPLTCAPNEDSNQPEHPRSLIIVVRMKKLCILGNMRPETILIGLFECAVWSESSLCAHVRRFVFWCSGSFDLQQCQAGISKILASVGMLCYNATDRNVHFVRKPVAMNYGKWMSLDVPPLNIFDSDLSQLQLAFGRQNETCFFIVHWRSIHQRPHISVPILISPKM